MQLLVDYVKINPMKSLFQSKTFWLAVLQAIVGILIVLSGEYPEIGQLFVAKSVIDVILRVMTTTRISGMGGEPPVWQPSV